jgi:hypothetical protein
MLAPMCNVVQTAAAVINSRSGAQAQRTPCDGYGRYYREISVGAIIRTGLTTTERVGGAFLSMRVESKACRKLEGKLVAQSPVQATSPRPCSCDLRNG